MDFDSGSRTESPSRSSEAETSGSGQSVPSRRLLHSVYVVIAVCALAMLFGGMLYVGYAEMPERMPLPTPFLPSPRPYATPVILPTMSAPSAFVSKIALRVFGSFGPSGDYISELQSGDRVQVLAQSADGLWTQVRSWDGIAGWVRTGGLLMAYEQYAVPTVRASRPPAILLADDFEDPASGLRSQVGETGEMYYQDGEYVICVTDANWIWWTFYPQVFMDCEVEVETRPMTGGSMEYGLAFRFWSGEGYLFVVSPGGGYRLIKRIDGSGWTLSQGGTTDAIQKGNRANRLRVRADGHQILLFVNDQLLETVTDISFDGGQIGLMVQSPAYVPETIEVHFDDLEVRSLTEYATPTASSQITATTTPHEETLTATLQVTPTTRPEQTLTTTLASTPSEICRWRHIVQRGENLSRIALRYGVSMISVAYANALSPDEPLREGVALCIPSVIAWPTDLTPNPSPIPGSGCRFMHVARSSETWFRIVMRYGASLEAIREANSLSDEDRYAPVPGNIYCIP